MIELGSVVRDTISGFQGKAVCRMKWLNGCDRIVIQPPVDKDGKLPDNQTFDEPQVELVQPPKNRPPSGTGVG